ncbi:RagB/SusD family nutrient uptake outer membrane protein [Parapedobacter koreensis]|uniref:Starch-binding associating with outer membrane n=1 Tax=Parapedobacter koreensis TaxID=332977 RepID=A0A1H7JTR7_9SPHI|nr:RagB/SusD family nutrient uptake outer membrane protein [Parapedobacter koreensis]SEK77764.1 Starch-binding associating with outer membrane [Parapedobacter koreensis]
MKLSKYIVKGVALLGIAGSLAACSDFLDEVNYSSQSAEEFFMTASGYENLVIGCYADLRSIYNSKDYINISQLGTDVVTQNFVGSVSPLNQYTVTFDANQGSLNAHWNRLYSALKNVNAAIGRAPDVLTRDQDLDGIDEAVLATRIAEAKFLRALYLFEIVKNWGQGPLLTEEPMAPVYTADMSPASAFYEQILSDLGEAIELLPTRQTGVNYGRASAAAAKHLRALVLLTRGYEDYAAPTDYQNAFNDAIDVINNSGHSLLDDYMQVHRQANQRNDEIIFSIGFSETANNNVNGRHMYYLFPYREGWPGLSKDNYYSNDDASFVPTKYFYMLFDWANDRRAEVTFMSPLNADPATSIDGRNTGKNWFQCTSPVAGRFALGDTVVYFPVPSDPNFKFWTQEDKDAVEFTVYNFPTGDPDDMSQDDYFRNAYQTSNSNTRAFLPVWKFKDANTIYNESNAASGTRNIYLFRLAETYLIAAEAALQNGDNGQASFYLNEVRERAAKVPGSLRKTGTITLDDILDERALELFGEVSHWNDLQRTGRLGERVLAHNWDTANIFGGIQTQLTTGESKFYLRPIPLAWLNTLSNGSEIGNNPGW